MALENLHRKTKHIFLKEKTCTRLDIFIPQLFCLLRDCIYDRIIKISINKSSDRIKRIYNSHTKSNDIKDGDVE